jgi:hypothetical protein
MPHGENVEGATELEALRLGGQPQRELDQVGKDLVSLALEVVLGRPQGFVAERIHGLRDVARCEESLAQLFVRVPTLVGRGATQTDVLEIDLTDIERGKLRDHLAVHPPSTIRVWPVI